MRAAHEALSTHSICRYSTSLRAGVRFTLQALRVMFRSCERRCVVQTQVRLRHVLILSRVSLLREGLRGTGLLEVGVQGSGRHRVARSWTSGMQPWVRLSETTPFWNAAPTSDETRSSTQGNCSAKSLAASVISSVLPCSSILPYPPCLPPVMLSQGGGVLPPVGGSHLWQGGGVQWGEGVWQGGGGQGIFQSSCHILHHHMVLRPERDFAQQCARAVPLCDVASSPLRSAHSFACSK